MILKLMVEMIADYRLRPEILVKCVENKLYLATECQEIKPITSDKGDSQASGKGTVLDATLGNS